MSDGIQLDHWRQFYEEAWEFRMKFIDGLIEQGETCPYRLIQSFIDRERTYQIKKEGGKFVWKKKPFEEDKAGQLPTGFPVFEQHIIRGQYVPMPYYTKVEYHRLLNDLVEKDGYDCVVDLGGGYGRYLIEMFYNGGQRRLKYIGAELTKSGREMMRKLFSLIPGADHGSPRV
jgi:hypothetical protein